MGHYYSGAAEVEAGPGEDLAPMAVAPSSPWGSVGPFCVSVSQCRSRFSGLLMSFLAERQGKAQEFGPAGWFYLGRGKLYAATGLREDTPGTHDDSQPSDGPTLTALALLLAWGGRPELSS